VGLSEEGERVKTTGARVGAVVAAAEGGTPPKPSTGARVATVVGARVLTTAVGSRVVATVGARVVATVGARVARATGARVVAMGGRPSVGAAVTMGPVVPVLPSVGDGVGAAVRSSQ